MPSVFGPQPLMLYIVSTCYVRCSIVLRYLRFCFALPFALPCVAGGGGSTGHGFRLLLLLAPPDCPTTACALCSSSPSLCSPPCRFIHLLLFLPFRHSVSCSLCALLCVLILPGPPTSPRFLLHISLCCRLTAAVRSLDSSLCSLDCYPCSPTAPSARLTAHLFAGLSTMLPCGLAYSHACPMISLCNSLAQLVLPTCDRSLSPSNSCLCSPDFRLCLI
jgi:hypothetical protein